MTDLEPLTPTDALEWYLDEKQTTAAASTVRSHRSCLGHFLRWCDAESVDNLNTLTGRGLHRYKVWRRDEGDLNAVTVKTQMDTLRVFIRWCEHVDGVEPDLSEKVLSPTLSDGENASDVLLDGETAAAVLDYPTPTSTPARLTWRSRCCGTRRCAAAPSGRWTSMITTAPANSSTCATARRRTHPSRTRRPASG
jgi:hypothetical protein